MITEIPSQDDSCLAELPLAEGNRPRQTRRSSSFKTGFFDPMCEDSPLPEPRFKPEYDDSGSARGSINVIQQATDKGITFLFARLPDVAAKSDSCWIKLQWLQKLRLGCIEFLSVGGCVWRLPCRAAA